MLERPSRSTEDAREWSKMSSRLQALPLEDQRQRLSELSEADRLEFSFYLENHREDLKAKLVKQKTGGAIEDGSTATSSPPEESACGAATKRGLACKRRRIKGQGFCSKHLSLKEKEQVQLGDSEPDADGLARNPYRLFAEGDGGNPQTADINQKKQGGKLDTTGVGSSGLTATPTAASAASKTSDADDGNEGKELALADGAQLALQSKSTKQVAKRVRAGRRHAGLGAVDPTDRSRTGPFDINPFEENELIAAKGHDNIRALAERLRLYSPQDRKVVLKNLPPRTLEDLQHYMLQEEHRKAYDCRQAKEAR